jgi:hypothetical protein
MIDQSTYSAAYDMGRLYRLIANEFPEGIGRPTKVSLANRNPGAGMVGAIRSLNTSRKLSRELDPEIRAILDNVDPEAVPSGHVCLELQAVWLLGYTNPQKSYAERQAQAM